MFPFNESRIATVWREGKVSDDAPDSAGSKWNGREFAAELISVLEHNAELWGG